MPDEVLVTAGLFVVGVGRSGGFRVIAAPQRMIDDGTFRLLRDVPVSDLHAESMPVASAATSPTAVGERFKVEGMDFGFGKGGELLDDAGRRFQAVRGLVLDSGRCVVVDGDAELFSEVPNLYRAFLDNEFVAPLATEAADVLVRPVDRPPSEPVPTPPEPSWLTRSARVLACLLLAGLLWFILRPSDPEILSPLNDCGDLLSPDLGVAYRLAESSASVEVRRGPGLSYERVATIDETDGPLLFSGCSRSEQNEAWWFLDSEGYVPEDAVVAP